MTADFWTSLFDVQKSVFGHRVLYVTLAVCLYLIFDLHLDYSYLEAGYTVSVLGLLLPLKSASNQLIDVLRLVFVCSSGLWVWRKATPWCGWLCFASFTTMVSIYWENLPWFRHKFVVPNLLLFVLALWFHYYRDSTSVEHSEPVWVRFLSLWSVLCFYGFSGLSKLRNGWTLGDGSSLQIWFSVLVDDGHPLRRLLLDSATFAALAQSGVLLLELSCFLGIVVAGIRIPLALCLTAFHILVHWTFGIPFLTSVPLILVVLLAPGRPIEKSS